MRIKRIVAALLAFAITVGIAGNAYAENTGQALTPKSKQPSATRYKRKLKFQIRSLSRNRKVKLSGPS